MSNAQSVQLAVCEIFNPAIHGQTNESSPDITSHFLVHTTVEPEEFYDLSFTDLIRMLRDGYHAYLSVWGDRAPYHPIVRNYDAIVRGDAYIKLDIVVLDELIGQECVGYLKTHWIRLVQRCWKRVFKERKQLIKTRSTPAALRYRSVHGCWPKGARRWPSFTLGLCHR
jgi:hypothetical protein